MPLVGKHKNNNLERRLKKPQEVCYEEFKSMFVWYGIYVVGSRYIFDICR
jgi:hypothetical protein